MQTTRSVLVGALFAMGMVNAASAYNLSPTQTKFTLAGSADILIEGQFKGCTITMTGKIPAHSRNSMIETFSDGGACGVVATNLPWPLRAKNATTATISNFAYTIPDNVCGPNNAHPSINSSGVWTLESRVIGSTHLCELRTTLTSTPPITIVP